MFRVDYVQESIYTLYVHFPVSSSTCSRDFLTRSHTTLLKNTSYPFLLQIQLSVFKNAVIFKFTLVTEFVLFSMSWLFDVPSFICQNKGEKKHRKKKKKLFHFSFSFMLYKVNFKHETILNNTEPWKILPSDVVHGHTDASEMNRLI